MNSEEFDSQSPGTSTDADAIADGDCKFSANGPYRHAHEDLELYDSENESAAEGGDYKQDEDGEVEEYEELETQDELEHEIEALVDDDIVQDEEYMNEEEEDIKERQRINDCMIQEVEEHIPPQLSKKKRRHMPMDNKNSKKKDRVVNSKGNVNERSGVKKTDVDEDQCRVCTAKDDLVSLFKTVEQQTIAEMIMTICPNVSITLQDFMPQYICNPCLDNVTIAVQFKIQCETTERELRKKLSRGKNKVRRPAAYVVVDATPESDPATEDEEELNDDAEFKVSDEVGASGDDDSEDSDFSVKRKRPGRNGGGRRGRRKNANASMHKIKKKENTVTRKRSLDVNPDFTSDDDGNTSHSKKKRSITPGDKGEEEFACDLCESVFTRKLSLILHKKAHDGGRKPINCEVCGKQFKIQGAYRTHLEKHKHGSVGHKCDNCNKMLPTRTDVRRHLSEAHGITNPLFQCIKCNRSFVSDVRLERHQLRSCRGYENFRNARKMDDLTHGRDLFKSVAPMTTTYWSDSFSD